MPAASRAQLRDRKTLPKKNLNDYRPPVSRPAIPAGRPLQGTMLSVISTHADSHPFRGAISIFRPCPTRASPT